MSTETNKMMFSYGSVDLAYELKFFHTEKSIYTILKSNMNFNLKNDRMISIRFQGKPFNIKSMPQPVTLKKLKLNSSMKTYKTF